MNGSALRSVLATCRGTVRLVNHLLDCAADLLAGLARVAPAPDIGKLARILYGATYEASTFHGHRESLRVRTHRGNSSTLASPSIFRQADAFSALETLGRRG